MFFKIFSLSNQTSLFKNKKSTLITFLASSIFLLAANNNHASDLKAYDAKYQGEYKGMTITLKRKLKKIADNHYSVSNTAENALAYFYENSDFRFISKDKIQSNNYQYITQYGPIKRSQSVVFDWTKKVAYDKENKKKSLALNKPIADKISYQVLLRQIVKSGKRGIFNIDLYSRGKLKTYTFKTLKEESITTPAGTFKALPVMRVYNDQKKNQTTWLAVDQDYILLKVLKNDKSQRYEISLSNFRLNKK